MSQSLNKLLLFILAMELEGIQISTAKLLDYAEFLKVVISICPTLLL